MNPFRYLLNGVANRWGATILGTHPHNTICSFNYTNLRHLCRFMRHAADTVGHVGTIVDVGAGKMPYHESFGSRAGKYIAVDYDARMLGLGEAGNIERRVGAAESLPADDACADVVLMNQVLEHVNCPDASFREVMRVVKPGGFFIGSVPHVSPVHMEPYDFRRYTVYGVRQLLQKHGFQVESIETSGGVYSCAALIICMELVLSDHVEGQQQGFSTTKAFWLSPIIGLMNLAGIAGDRILPSSNRTPANLTWIARRPEDGQAT